MLLIGNYFGARYYDARIANWGSVDPLFEKHIGWNPYNYVLRNPMALIDPDGRQIFVGFSGAGFTFGGSEIGRNDPDIGTHILMNNVRELLSNSTNENYVTKEYYASIGLFGDKPEVEDAYNEIVKYKENNPDKKVFLYGLSQGGANIIELASKLNDVGITVNALFTIDAYDGLLCKSNFNITDNVIMNFNFYQLTPDKDTHAHGGKNKGNLMNVKNRLKSGKYNGEEIDHRSIDEATIDDVLRLLKRLL